MYTHFVTFLIAYIIGGITLFPLTFLIIYYCPSLLKSYPPSDATTFKWTSDLLEQEFHQDDPATVSSSKAPYRTGWLHVTSGTHTANKMTSSSSSSLGGLVKSYLMFTSNNNATSTTQKDDETLSTPAMPLAHTLLPRSYFAVLKLNTLYLYDSELQLECKETIQVDQYTVQIYPANLKDHELFSKSTCIQLKCNDMTHCNYLLNCNRCVTKEDWYFALIRASQWNSTDKIVNKTATHFDQEAMNHLLSTVYSSPRQFELRWFNALLGRLFLGIYRTETTQSFFYNKILSKVQKLNARRPPFLEEITLRSVDSGHGAPQITQPRLVQLSPQGEYTGEVQLFYDGHFRVELETVLRWKYSERLPAIRIDLVLAITLRSIEGRLMVKLKEPPTNRVWLGFYEKPRMDWLVEPVVWEKRVGYSVVSKAIQAKIEEIFTETIVLPNMDDTVFFPTEGAGGIFDTPQSQREHQKQCHHEQSPDYQSLPELYSTPSELVVTSEPVSLVSSDHQFIPPPIKKKWFKRNSNNNNLLTPSSSLPTTLLTTNSDIETTVIPVFDTPSQQSLKSVMTSSSSRCINKRKAVTTTEINTRTRSKTLSTHIDHSVVTDTNKVFPHLDPQQKKKVESPPTIVISPDQEETTNNNNVALRSVRLSKKMLSLTVEQQQQPSSRIRSKSLPSTGLTEVSIVKK